MTIKSRWEIPIPRCSLQQWIFGSSNEPLPSQRVLLDADRPDERFLTKAEYRLLAKRIALGLQRAGLKPGDRVLVFSGNSVWFPAVFVGVLMAGGIFTGANPGYVMRELSYQLRDSGASFLLASPEGMPVALEAAAEAKLPRDHIYLFDPALDPKVADPSPPATKVDYAGARHWAELLRDTLARAEGWDWAEPADPASVTCCLNYSSGTTGVPKGVEISHAAYVANCEGVLYVNSLDPAVAEREARDRALCFLPLYHAFAQTYFVASHPRLGTPVYVMPTFDFPKMLSHVQKYRITALTLVPPVVVALAKHPLVRQFDLSSVETIGCGAAPLDQKTAEECARVVSPGSNLFVRQGWGMTELTCTAMGWNPTQEARTTAAVGELLPNASARLVATDGSGSLVTEANKPGELWISAPNMMRGYWNNPKATAETILVDPKDGSRWLRTGDIAYVEEYRPGTPFHIVDRLKELIKVKGNQVAPAELEAVLLERPDIADAAVVGVTIGGEELPRAYIVPSPAAPKRPEPAEIAEWFATRVARFKQLKGGIVLTDAIPKNPSGKILRKALREKAKAEAADLNSRL